MLENGIHTLQYGHFFEATAMKPCATMCSLKRITPENGQDVTFGLSHLSTFLL